MRFSAEAQLRTYQFQIDSLLVFKYLEEMPFLDQDAVIPESKLTRYLLVRLTRNDKSQFLAQASYTLENWQQLEQDLKTQILPLKAVPTVNTEFGQKYEISGLLTGPNGVTLMVKTVWIVTLQETRFVTLVPA